MIMITFYLDIMECMMEGHNCSHMCVELEGSFNCSCYSGYKLQEDGVTCEGNCIVRVKHCFPDFT